MNALAAPIAPASALDWQRFLRPLNLAVANPLAEREFTGRCIAIAFALPDVGLRHLTEAAQRDAVRTWRFFPTPAEVAEWIGPTLKGERESRLLRERNLALPAPEQPQRTPEQREALAAYTAAKLAELRQATRALEAPEPHRVRPLHLRPEHLAEARRAAGIRLADTAEGTR